MNQYIISVLFVVLGIIAIIQRKGTSRSVMASRQRFFGFFAPITSDKQFQKAEIVMISVGLFFMIVGILIFLGIVHFK